MTNRGMMFSFGDWFTMHFIRRLLRWGMRFLLLGILFVVGANIWVVNSTADKVLFTYEALPDSYDVALVPGTSPLLAGGLPNLFFSHRMETAATLYEKGKVSHIIVSGDNRTKYYNEPAEMKKKLLALGIPASVITLDYAGLRTLDSIVRGKEIFGQHRFVIVTQAFHGYRALFIAAYYDIDALVLATDDIAQNSYPLITWREYLARAKAVLDLYIFKTTPRYMGKKEPLS